MSGLLIVGTPDRLGLMRLAFTLDGAWIAAGIATAQEWARLVELATSGDMYVVRTENGGDG